jgi:hypothetical protein
MNQKGFGRKWSWLNRGTIPAFAEREKTKGKLSVSTKFPNRHLPNTSLEQHL